MFIFITILLLFYLCNGLFYLINIKKLDKKVQNNFMNINASSKYISIIIPAKNESKTIENCLQGLLEQDYPADYMEIILVNDCSEDNTGEIIDQYSEKYTYIQSIHIDRMNQNNNGKLYAIDQGVIRSKGDIIITTDADIEMGKKWVSSMVANINSDIGLIVGMTMDNYTNKVIHLFQALDGASIKIVSALFVTIGFPITCQGSNLAFLKEAYMEVRSRVLELGKAYGNREWLMQEIDMHTKWGIKEQLAMDSIAYTKPQDSWSSLINQRSRWASTGKNYSKMSIRLYLTMLYFSFVSLLIIPFILNFKLTILIWSVKLLIDYLVTIQMLKLINDLKLIKAFPIVFILQPILVVLTAFLGTFRMYKWK